MTKRQGEYAATYGPQALYNWSILLQSAGFYSLQWLRYVCVVLSQHYLFFFIPQRY